MAALPLPLPSPGRARGFSFSFFRPSGGASLSSSDLAHSEEPDGAAAGIGRSAAPPSGKLGSGGGGTKKRFSASGLLRPSSASSSSSTLPSATSPLGQPSPPSVRTEVGGKGGVGKQQTGKGRYAREQQQVNGVREEGEEGEEGGGGGGGIRDSPASSQQHSSHGYLPAAHATPPIREDLFLFDNPAPLFSSKQKIGRGGFGDVYTGKDKTSNQVVAIKILKKPYSEHGEQICNELEILRSCRHENIVNYLRSYLFKDRVWMIMEYCDGGSLQSLISGVDLNEGQIANVLCKVLSGLQYLHKQNRIHRDIKADNILLNINGAVKVADLGLCAELKDGDDFKAGMVGSRYWMAPEVIRRERYNTKADVWSLGAVAMEMAQQHPPYHGQPSLKVLFTIATKGAPPLKSPKKWSPEFQDFIAQCFTMDPDLRPSAEQLLAHPFIAKASPSSKLEQAISIVFLGDSLKMNGF